MSKFTLKFAFVSLLLSWPLSWLSCYLDYMPNCDLTGLLGIGVFLILTNICLIANLFIFIKNLIQKKPWKESLVYVGTSLLFDLLFWLFVILLP